MALWAPQTETEPGRLGFRFCAPNAPPHSILPLPPPTVISTTQPPPHWSPPGTPRIVCSLAPISSPRGSIFGFLGQSPPRCSISPHPPPTVISTTHPPPPPPPLHAPQILSTPTPISNPPGPHSP